VRMDNVLRVHPPRARAARLRQRPPRLRLRPRQQSPQPRRLPQAHLRVPVSCFTKSPVRARRQDPPRAGGTGAAGMNDALAGDDGNHRPSRCAEGWELSYGGPSPQDDEALGRLAEAM
jgi:hypothetical protein